MMQEIVIIGGGFAGLWSAVSAARRLDELSVSARITLVNRDTFHSIRVRNYEADLKDTIIELERVLGPIGVAIVVGEVTALDVDKKIVRVDHTSGNMSLLHYDRLILASGSKLVKPDIEGIEHTFDVDTYWAADKLRSHIQSLTHAAEGPGLLTAIVVGSGATGVEVATELPDRLRAIAAARGDSEADRVKVILADRQPVIAGGLGEGRFIVELACRDLGIELVPNCLISKIDNTGVTLADGSKIEAQTVVWCGGMRAEGLTNFVPGKKDQFGRLFVDEFMRVDGMDDVFAAGDAAHSLINGTNSSMMSCQHARPMGRYAGTNVVNDLFRSDLLPLYIDWYTNIIDLGPWGAVYTQGWDREVVAHGVEAKRTKTVINRERIYPPLCGTRDAILGSGSTVIQRPPVLVPLRRRDSAA